MVNYLRAAFLLYSIKRHIYWSRDRLLKHQTTELRRIVNYAFNNVPFWHRRFKDNGLKPDDIETVDDLNKLPILRKSEVRRNFSQMISRDFDARSLKRIVTSGSTGRPLTLYINSKEDEFRKARHLRANVFCGQKMRDNWVVITSPYRFEKIARLPQLLKIYAMNTLSVYEDPCRQLIAVEKMRPNILEGYSSSLYLLAKQAERQGVETIRPRIMFSGAELIDDMHRRFIAETFDAPIYDQYAANEFERIAWECPAKIGYHIEADALIVQFVDENGDAVAPGERGEIICTSLFNYAMPLIRYALGDIGVSASEECTCGLRFPLMKMIEGRSNSIIFLEDGRPISPLAFICAMQLFRLFNHIEQWRIVQNKRDVLRVDIKKASQSVDEAKMQIELVSHLRKILELDSKTNIEVSFVDDIPLDKSGKLTKFVSSLQGNPFG